MGLVEADLLIEGRFENVANDGRSPGALGAAFPERGHHNLGRFHGSEADEPGIVLHGLAGLGSFQDSVGGKLRGSGFAADFEAGDASASASATFVDDAVETVDHLLN